MKKKDLELISVSIIKEAATKYDPANFDSRSVAKNTVVEINGKQFPVKAIGSIAYSIAYNKDLPLNSFTTNEMQRYFDSLKSNEIKIVKLNTTTIYKYDFFEEAEFSQYTYIADFEKRYSKEDQNSIENSNTIKSIFDKTNYWAELISNAISGFQYQPENSWHVYGNFKPSLSARILIKGDESKLVFFTIGAESFNKGSLLIKLDCKRTKMDHLSLTLKPSAILPTQRIPIDYKDLKLFDIFTKGNNGKKFLCINEVPFKIANMQENTTRDILHEDDKMKDFYKIGTLTYETLQTAPAHIKALSITKALIEETSVLDTLDQGKVALFDSYLKQNNVSQYQILASNVDTYDWDRLVKESVDFINQNLDHYKNLVNLIYPNTFKQQENTTTMNENDSQLNIIFYGPPGTGKTHTTIEKAIAITNPTFRFRNNDGTGINREEIKKEYQRICDLGQIEFITFHQSLSYEDFIEGIKPDLLGGTVSYSIEPGLFRNICKRASQQSDGSTLTSEKKNYVLIIDEINRGNISQIFGELITLIEDDKRLGNAESLEVLLPYSKKKFGVPSNLYIIGTMNTADRSVEALDTALRRRFSFIEMPPDEKHKYISIEMKINNSPFNFQEILETINKRLEKLVGRDHKIGHSYFITTEKNKKWEFYRSAFEDKIVPLLQEYFYGDYAKMCLVLGKGFVKEITKKVDSNFFAAIEYDGIEELRDKQIWQIQKIDSEQVFADALNTLLNKNHS